MVRYASQQTPPPLNDDTLRTRDGHRLAFAMAGALDGVPVVVLHRSPSSGSQPSVPGLFDLTRFRFVLIDQRDTGASNSFGSLRGNRTAQLIDDISRRRAPRAWTQLSSAAHCSRSAALSARCAQVLQSGSGGARQHAVALAWQSYDDAVLVSACTRGTQSRTLRSHSDARKLTGKYRIQADYLKHRCWLGESRLLSLTRRADAAGVPLAAVHGTHNPDCPPDNMRPLARAVPAARIDYVHTGHPRNHPALRDRATCVLKTMFYPIAYEGCHARRAT